MYYGARVSTLRHALSQSSGLPRGALNTFRVVPDGHQIALAVDFVSSDIAPPSTLIETAPSTSLSRTSVSQLWTWSCPNALIDTLIKKHGTLKWRFTVALTSHNRRTHPVAVVENVIVVVEEADKEVAGVQSLQANHSP